VDIEDLDASPRITDVLSSAFGTGKRVPRVQTIQFLRASPSADARAFLEVYWKMGVRDRENVPIEAICIAARVNPLAILGAVLTAAKTLKSQESALKAIMAHPDVTQATIDAATKGVPLLVNGAPIIGKDGLPVMMGYGDLKAQRTIHEAVGFLPTKNGSNIAFNLSLGPGGAKQDDNSEGDEELESFKEAFPTISGELEEWSENRRLLTDGK
jgi:hypothetical protein